MGCLKLSYYQTYSNQKGVYSDCVLEPKTAQMWLSVDPMSDKYPSMSPYNYCANNPVMLTDPDGRWIPGLDGENNIIVTAEEGDNLESFIKFMGSAHNKEDIECAYEQMQNGQINLTTTIGGVFQLMTNAITEGVERNNPTNADYDNGTTKGKNMSENYNCWGATIALLNNKRLHGTGLGTGVSIDNDPEFDKILETTCIPVDRNTASVGKTAVRFGIVVSEHAATFMGVDNKGNEYFFSKNGFRAIPEIITNSYITKNLKDYGSIKGRLSTESGYYNKK